MTERKIETIAIGKGVQYAKVAARSAEFHRDNKECAIETSCEFKDGFVLFSAKVTTKKGTFTGHSMDKVSGRQKQFEKQETIAVGRALAFAGYLSSGDIACQEEMDELAARVTTAQLNALKLKFSTIHKDDLKGLDRLVKARRFNQWAKGVIEEDADFTDVTQWDREWLDACWKALVGTDSDVPFDKE